MFSEGFKWLGEVAPPGAIAVSSLCVNPFGRGRSRRLGRVRGRPDGWYFRSPLLAIAVPYSSGLAECNLRVVDASTAGVPPPLGGPEATAAACCWAESSKSPEVAARE